ncbi:YDL121C [Saccharomyces arboricola H-6]|uniref:YDL121C n=1 Tax=Saccharomyces arboricola (strain H-6 / AS 2.3317 / CBS 10644) TaxID=1160507 RepID=J8PQA6_SACAR|nr:YDL121C [Saccharomyces arboricola H-6]
MHLYGYFVLFIVVVLFIALLPLFSGIGTFKLTKPSSSAKAQPTTGKLGKRDFLKNKLNQTNVLKFNLKDGKDVSEDNSTGVSSAPRKFEVDSKTGLKRRVIGRFNQDPNDFDFDIDELINEDNLEEQKQEEKKLKEYNGKKHEAYEAFV